MKLHAPSAPRNRQPIADVLAEILPPSGVVLEVASGTGQHIVFFAARFPHLTWLPTEIEPNSLASIQAWCQEAGLENIQPPQALDAAAARWPVPSADVLININMIHIAPWEVCQGLIAGARRTLTPNGILFLYGPYRIKGRPTAPSNEEFDANLRAHNPAWGLRYVDEVEKEAESHGFTLDRIYEMPANNLSLAFRRYPGQ